LGWFIARMSSSTSSGRIGAPATDAMARITQNMTLRKRFTSSTPILEARTIYRAVYWRREAAVEMAPKSVSEGRGSPAAAEREK
jgi:hypothetical protein